MNAVRKDSDKKEDEDEMNGVQGILPLSLDSLVGPLKSQLLLLCRVAKENLSDDALNHVTLRFPAAIIQKYSGEYVILRGKKMDVDEDIKDENEDGGKEEEDEALEVEEEEYKWDVVSQEEEEEADLVIDILREEFEAACFPVLEVSLTARTFNLCRLTSSSLVCLATVLNPLCSIFARSCPFSLLIRANRIDPTKYCYR